MIKMLEREQIIIDESVFSPNYIIRNLPKILYQSTLCECHVKWDKTLWKLVGSIWFSKMFGRIVDKPPKEWGLFFPCRTGLTNKLLQG